MILINAIVPIIPNLSVSVSFNGLKVCASLMVFSCIVTPVYSLRPTLISWIVVLLGVGSSDCEC